MVTFFACPKPFQGHINTIQRNAIRSWMLLNPTPEIILLGVDKGVAEISEEYGLIHIPDIDRNEFGTPLVSSVFYSGQAKASSSIVCYINSDIMLMHDFLWAIETVAAKMPRFLILGQRTDVDIKEAWDFDAVDWEEDLRRLVLEKGTLHAQTGIDYFCFPRGMYTDIPPFAIGRLRWDNWLVWRARSTFTPIVDATHCITVIHQNHDYPAGTIQRRDDQKMGAGSHDDSISDIDSAWVKGPEAIRNDELASESAGQFGMWAATWKLDRHGSLKRRIPSLAPDELKSQLKWVLPLYVPASRHMVRWVVSARKAVQSNQGKTT